MQLTMRRSHNRLSAGYRLERHGSLLQRPRRAGVFSLDLLSVRLPDPRSVRRPAVETSRRFLVDHVKTLARR